MTRPLRPGVASALLRVPLIAWAGLVLASMPENLRTWDDPNASVIPGERTMPQAGSVLVAVAMALSIVMLAVGWVARRRDRGTHTFTRAAIGVGLGVFLDGIAALAALATAAVLARDAAQLRTRRTVAA